MSFYEWSVLNLLYCIKSSNSLSLDLSRSLMMFLILRKVNHSLQGPPLSNSLIDSEAKVVSFD